MTMVWHEWDVAVAVRLDEGNCTASITLGLFCKHCEDARWGWRIGVCEEDWCGELCGSVETFLVWFAGYGELTEEELKCDFVDLDDEGYL